MKETVFIFTLLFFLLPGLNAQQDPDTSATVSSWKLVHDFTRQNQSKIDTLLPLFHIQNPVWKNSFSNTFTGNLGSASQTNILFQRENKTVFLPFMPLQDYMELTADVKYYWTHKPYTHLYYSSGGPKSNQEQILNVVHTQNFNQYLNFAVQYSLFSSVGQYPNLKARDNAFSFSSNYLRKRYTLHGNIVVNKMVTADNGGTLDDTIPVQKDFSYVPVHLEYAGNSYLHIGGMITQSMHFGKFPWKTNDSTQTAKENYLSSLHYTIQYDRFYRKFSITDLTNRSGMGDNFSDAEYFRNFFLSTQSTQDSVYFRKFRQSAQLELHESPGAWFRFRGRAGVFHEIFSYLNYAPNPLTASGGYFFPWPAKYNYSESYPEKISNPFSSNLFNLGLNASIRSEAGSVLAWTSSGEIVWAGYNQGDYTLQASLETKFAGQLTYVRGGRKSTKPEFFLRQYTSNHYQWDFPGRGNDLKKEGVTWLQAVSQGRFFDATAELRLLDKYIYFTDSGPAQHPDVILASSLVIGKVFNIGRLYSDLRIAAQFTGSDFLHVPAFALRNTTWFEQSIVKNVLTANLGFNVYYFTNYYADGYNPATGLFYLQNEQKIGNYPFVDVFLNMKLKRTRIMVMYDHVNSGLLPRTYFTAYQCPVPARVLKFGISWTFYD